MRAAWYEKNGPAAEVLRVGEIPIPEPGPGEVRVRIVASGLNPTDVKSRRGSRPMGFPRVVPHQDGAGVIDKVGRGVPASRVGERVWLYIVQWQRAWGTAAEYSVVPARLAVTLPNNTTFAQGACLGIPRSEEHTSELQSLAYLVCRLLLEKKKNVSNLTRFIAALTQNLTLADMSDESNN